MRGVSEFRGRLSRLLGDKTHPRHRAADRPGLALVPPPEGPRYEVNVNALMQFWRAEVDDEIGGWCVVINREGTPATGNPSLGNFMHERHAHHMADVHNDWLARQVGRK